VRLPRPTFCETSPERPNARPQAARRPAFAGPSGPGGPVSPVGALRPGVRQVPAQIVHAVAPAPARRARCPLGVWGLHLAVRRAWGRTRSALRRGFRDRGPLPNARRGSSNVASVGGRCGLAQPDRSVTAPGGRPLGTLRRPPARTAPGVFGDVP